MIGYLYVQPDVVDVPYLVVVGEILLLSVFAARRFLFQKNEAIQLQMFFLGSAFMLLELHAISFLSLLYGSTWITASIVINGILIMILIANTFVIRFGVKISGRQSLVYLGLIASILLNYYLPTEQIINSTYGWHLITNLLITTVTLLPIGAAAIIFSSAFSATSNASKSLAFNLFGP